MKIGYQVLAIGKGNMKYR